MICCKWLIEHLKLYPFFTFSLPVLVHPEGHHPPPHPAYQYETRVFIFAHRRKLDARCIVAGCWMLIDGCGIQSLSCFVFGGTTPTSSGLRPPSPQRGEGCAPLPVLRLSKNCPVFDPVATVFAGQKPPPQDGVNKNLFYADHRRLSKRFLKKKKKADHQYFSATDGHR